MFGDFSDMIHFLLVAPWFIIGGFLVSFLTTFSAIKITQSDSVYDWFTQKTDEMRARRAQRMRRRVMRDATQFRGGRKVKEMSKEEQKHYFKILECGYDEVERLFKRKGDGDERAGR